MNRAWWHGRRVFVTGHTGFKGGWCALWLARLGADVTGYALAPATQPNLYDDAGISRVARSVIGDIRDLDGLTSALCSSRAEVVLHIAAQSLVLAGYARPLETYAVNVVGTVNVVEAMRRCGGVRAALIVTSDKCYRLDDPRRRHPESDPLGGRDPYSASKAGAELVTGALRTALFETGAAIATVRAGNVIGGGDYAPDRLVPDLLRAFAGGRPATIRHPDAVRPWQHVLDPLCGYLDLVQRLCDERALARAWNFGPPPSHDQPVRRLADELAALWGPGAAWQTVGHAGHYEAPALRLDSGKAKRHLGWTARLPLRTALEWVADWHKRRAAGASARELTLDEIARYEALNAA